MNEQKLKERVALNRDFRLRKSINMVQRSDPEKLYKTIKSLLPTRFWIRLGYERLYDCLVDELGIGIDPAGDLVVEAIKLKIEDRRMYGNDDTESDERSSTGGRKDADCRIGMPAAK